MECEYGIGENRMNDYQHYVQQTDGTWKKIKTEDIQKYLNYGCKLKAVKK